MLRLTDKPILKGAFGFRSFDSDMKPIPLFKETTLGRFLRVALDKKHSKEEYDPRTGPPWHHMLQKRRACGIWTVDPVWSENLLVTAGKAVIASRINGADGEAAVTFLEVGTGATAENVADVLLDAAILAATDTNFDRQAATVTREAPSNTTARLDTTFGTAGTGHAVVEAGDFNIVTENTAEMLARTVFSVINISTGGSLQVIYDHLVS